MSKARWKKGAALISAITAMGMMVANFGSVSNEALAASSQKPNLGGSILLDTTSNFQHLDPALSYFTTDYEAVCEVYEQLVTYQGPQGKIIPDLATNWSISKDGKTYTFHIRKGVTFTNGDPMTAQSFVDEFERVLGKDGTVSQGEGFIDPIVVGSPAYNKAKVKPKNVKGISAPNPYTLVIHLSKPEPFFLNILAMPFFSAVDQKYIDKVGAKKFDAGSLMGTGPFEVDPKSVTPNGMVLTKNPHYWMTDKWGNHLPYLDKVTIRINKDGNVDSLNFEQGTTAIIGNLFQGIPSSSFPKFKTDPNLKKTLYSAPQNAVWYLGQNVKVAPFNNPKVRVAFSYAINKAKIVQLLNGRGQVANQPLPPGLQGYVKNLPASVNYTYNPAKAKKLLAAAGYKPGKLSVTVYSQNDPDFIKMTNSIAYDLQQIGVNCKIHLMDDNAFWNEAETGKFGLFIGGWIQDFPDASDFMNTLLNSNEAPANNMTNYSNPKVDALLNKAQTDPNQAQRWKLYGQATEQIMKDAPWIPLYYPVAYYAAQTWVHGFYISPTLPDPLQYVWIDSGHSQG